MTTIPMRADPHLFLNILFEQALIHFQLRIRWIMIRTVKAMEM